MSYSQQVSLPVSQRQQAAGHPTDQHFMTCFYSLCCSHTEFLTREGTDTSRLSLLQTTIEILENGKKKFQRAKFKFFVGHAEVETLPDGAHNFQVKENNGSEKPLTPSSLLMELYVKRNPWDGLGSKMSLSLRKTA